MPVYRLRDAADPRVDRYRSISDAELLTSDGVFVAEGRAVVARVIEECGGDVRSVLVNDAAYRSLEPVLVSIADRVPVYIAGPGDFPAVVGFDHHRGCLALVARPPARRMSEVVDGCLAASQSDRREASASLRASPALIALEGVANPDNIGGVFRNASAFGAGGVLLDVACCDPLYRKAIRTSMAASLRVPFARVEGWLDTIDGLRRRGFAIAALTPRGDATAIDVFAATRPARVVLLVGNEWSGLSDGVEAAADVRVRIPIAPEVDSLNLAVAVGIALHRLK